MDIREILIERVCRRKSHTTPFKYELFEGHSGLEVVGYS